MSLPSPAPKPSAQPKVVQKLVLRTLILVIALGAILLGIRWYRDSRADPNGTATAETAGYISAVQYRERGQQAVIIKPDLSILESAGYRPGATDRDEVWAPSGNFLFFISDRGADSYQVYRWNPDSDPEIRSVGKRGRSYPSFQQNQSGTDQKMLVTSGGIVMQLDPTDRSQVQILPPIGREIAVGSDSDDAAKGAESQFAAMYGAMGTSFREARWVGNNDFIMAVMRRDEGEALVVQDMKLVEGATVPPKLIAAGEHIDFDVNPVDGSVVFAVNGFQWPERPPESAIKNGKVTKPFEHYIGIWDPKHGVLEPVVAAVDNVTAFSSIAVDPTGKDFVAAVGPYENGVVTHKGIVKFPTRPNSGKEGNLILRGEIYEPSWDPSGRLLVYAKRDGGHRTIFTANADGSSERNLTGDKGDFANPRFSPQTK